MVDLSRKQPLKPDSKQPSSPFAVQPSVAKPLPKKAEPAKKTSFPPLKEKIVTPKQETVKKELSELGISPKGGSKKTKVLLAALGVLFLVATLPVAVYLVQQRQEIRKEAAIGNRDHCASPSCTVTIGPDQIAFKVKGHGTRDTKTPTVNLSIPEGSTVFKAFVLWGGERKADINIDRNFNLSVNGGSAQQVVGNAASYTTSVADYNTRIDSFLADITSLLPTETTSFSFKVESGYLQGGYNSDRNPGAGYGIAFIVIYKNSTNPHRKIVIKIWDEFVLRNSSANMAFNLADRKAGSSNLRMAFFFGEGEGSTGADRPNYLYYNENSNQQLTPTDGTKYPAWGSDPGNWWDTRITGGNLPAISALGNTATFHTYSPKPADDPEGRLGDSFTWLGGMAEYETEPPRVSGCWEECGAQSECDDAGLTCAVPPGDTLQRCLEPQCPSESTCLCPATACLDLTATPATETLEEGDKISLTCKGSAGIDKPIDHFEFRAKIDGGSWQDLDTSSATKTNGESEGTVDYTASSTGDYRIECRACTSSDSSECTVWGEAK